MVLAPLDLARGRLVAREVDEQAAHDREHEQAYAHDLASAVLHVAPRAAAWRERFSRARRRRKIERPINAAAPGMYTST